MAKSKKNTWVLWSKDEVKLLKKLYPKESMQSIADKLGRPSHLVSNKARRIGIRKKETYHPPWSIQEETLLKKLYPDNSFRDIAGQIGRTVSAVAGKAHELGLRKTDTYPIWSKKELNLLKKLYRSRTAQEVADQIGRTVYAVRLRLFRLGLNKRFRYEESHRVVSGVKQKRCSKCKQWKAESKFHKSRKSKDGFETWCKKCVCEAARKYRKRQTAVRN